MSTTGAARMVTEGGDPVEQRVTPLELFFDLVFVFALTQVTGFLVDHLTWLGMLQAAALLTVLWSSWASYPARSLGDVRLRLGVGTAIRPRVERGEMSWYGRVMMEDFERRRRMEEKERVCEVCGAALDQQAAERIATALDGSPFWREMRQEPELVALVRERRPDIFAMAIGMEVCTACREKAHREGGWASDSVAD